MLGVAYWVAGVPSPVLLGVVTGFMALIPGAPPVLHAGVAVPGRLRPHGRRHRADGLGQRGAVHRRQDPRPRLVGGPVKLPFLPTFFGLVGGVKTMGIVGLFVGPVLMALLVAVWREWVHHEEQERDAAAGK